MGWYSLPNIIVINNVYLFRYVSIFTPYKIGFVEDGNFPEWDIWDNIVDFFFLFDLILTFFCAYYDEESKIITNSSSIACNYLKSWFFIDLMVFYYFHYFSHQSLFI